MSQLCFHGFIVYYTYVQISLAKQVLKDFGEQQTVGYLEVYSGL